MIPEAAWPKAIASQCHFPGCPLLGQAAQQQSEAAGQASSLGVRQHQRRHPARFLDQRGEAGTRPRPTGQAEGLVRRPALVAL